jgi:hypothetical protein
VLSEDLYTKVFGLGDIDLIIVVEKSFLYYILSELEE